MKSYVYPSPEMLGMLPVAGFDRVFSDINPGSYVSEMANKEPDSPHHANISAARLAIVSACEAVGWDMEKGRVFDISLEHKTALPGSAVREVSKKWHADSHPLKEQLVLIADVLTTEFLSGDVPKRLARRMEVYPDTGYGELRSYNRNIEKILEPLSERRLKAMGFRITTAKPLQAAAFGGFHIHRSPLNATDSPIHRRFLKARVRLP